MDDLLNSSDYLLDKAVITSLLTGQTVDIRSVMEELNLYDSIFSTTVSGNIIIRDSLGLLKSLPIVGNETITIKVIKPQISELEKTFRIYKLTDRKQITNTSESYILHFCSHAQFQSEQMKISRSYTHKTNSFIVSNILANDLEYRGTVNLEDTVGNYNVVIPNLSPLESCLWLAKRSLNSQNVPSFLFFESLNDGYIFGSLLALSKNLDTSLTYYDAIKISQTDFQDKLFGINYSEKELAFDILNSLKSGVYSGVNYGLDLTTLSFEKTLFSADEYFQNPMLNTYINKPVLQDTKGNSSTLNYNTSLKITNLTKNQLKSNYIKNRDRKIFSNDTDKITLQRQHIMENIFSNKIYLSVPGFTALSAGRVINLDFTSRQMDAQDQQDAKDYVSGRYYITSTRHQFTPNGIYNTFLECSTDSYD